MPKEPTRSIDRHKVRGSGLNEFDFQKHQGQMADEFQAPGGDVKGGSTPRTRAEQVAQVIAAAKRKVAKRRKRDAARAHEGPKLAPPQVTSGRKTSASPTVKRAGSKAGAKKAAPGKTKRSPKP
jgi:hypothetical protein